MSEKSCRTRWLATEVMSRRRAPLPGMAALFSSARQGATQAVLALSAVCLTAACGTAENPDEALSAHESGAGSENVTETSTSALLAERALTCDRETIGYLEHRPADEARTGSERHPTLIFLHGKGQRGKNLQDLVNEEDGPLRHISKGHPMRFTVDGKTEQLIVIAPQLSTGPEAHPLAWLTCVIDHVLADERVDPDRLYLTGLSMGGYGTYTAVTHPPLARKIAAAAPIAGGGPAGKACVIAEHDIPIWAFHGDADATVRLSAGRRMVDAINACPEASFTRPIFTIYPSVGHNSWSRAYSTGHAYHDPNLYEWLLRQRRRPTDEAHPPGALEVAPPVTPP
ncbi:hypothetical protein [Chondromyces crocatus]|uniref:Phospholipase n=1 Tax=Chondromyces crocatus TaxID=52 RepID=A0A0K1EBS4_CHOCO|nr:hypothetical protein [Chondromyces crocatus]AKT38304.1 uncharacterized protein CMC5_024490 [Chondromyces crocatus]